MYSEQGLKRKNRDGEKYTPPEFTWYLRRCKLVTFWPPSLILRPPLHGLSGQFFLPPFQSPPWSPVGRFRQYLQPVLRHEQLRRILKELTPKHSMEFLIVSEESSSKSLVADLIINYITSFILKILYLHDNSRL